MDTKAKSGRRFITPVLEPGMTVGTAFKAIAMAALAQVAGNAEDLRQSPSAEVVHQLRVGVRRLQGTISAFKPIVSDQSMHAVKVELKWLMGELNPARNLDVFLAGAFARASRVRRDEENLADWGKRLQTARKAAYIRARHAVESDRFSALLLAISTWIAGGPWTGANSKKASRRDGPVGEFAASALEKARGRARMRPRRFERVGRAARHKLRIKTKTLRYIADVFEGFFTTHPRRATRFVGRIKVLLDCLGELNDIATGEGFIDHGSAFRRLNDRQASREKRFMGLARHALAAFRNTKKFWPEAT